MVGLDWKVITSVNQRYIRWRTSRFMYLPTIFFCVVIYHQFVLEFQSFFQGHHACHSVSESTPNDSDEIDTCQNTTSMTKRYQRDYLSDVVNISQMIVIQLILIAWAANLFRYKSIRPSRGLILDRWDSRLLEWKLMFNGHWKLFLRSDNNSSLFHSLAPNGQQTTTWIKDN